MVRVGWWEAKNDERKGDQVQAEKGGEDRAGLKGQTCGLKSSASVAEAGRSSSVGDVSWVEAKRLTVGGRPRVSILEKTRQILSDWIDSEGTGHLLG
jgi:hypothetical protein